MTEQVVTLRLTANAQGLIAGVQLAKRETDGLGGAGEKAGRQISTGIGGASNVLRNFAIQAAAAFSLRGMVRMADEAANLRSRLGLVTDSQAELAAAMDQTYAIAQRTSTGLASTAELYGRMQKAADGLGRSQSDALRTTELINKTFQVSGTAAATANAAIIQLSQGLGAGALRGDEFNSVLEGSPRLAEALRASLGATDGQLRAMAESGQLTAETIINALLEQGEVIDAEFAQLPLTVGRAWTQVENAALAAIGKIDSVLGGSGALAAGLQALVGYIEKIPRAMSLWVEAFDGAGAAFDLLLGPASDVVSKITDEFLILPVSLRTAVTIIIGEFDQLRISAVEKFDLLLIAGERAWLALEASASGLAGELEILLGGAIDMVARKYAELIDGLASSASTLGMDSIATSLRAMSSEIQTAANYEQTIRAEVEASAAAYRAKGAALEAASASITDAAAREIAASQGAVAASLAERDAALLQINTQEDLAAASTTTGAAIVAANKATGLSTKEAAKATKEQADAIRTLQDMIEGYAYQLAGPVDQAWMEYEAAVREANAAAETAIDISRKLGEAGEDEARILALQEAAIDGATQARDRAIEAAKRQADVFGRLLADLDQEVRLSGMTTQQRRIEEIVLRAVADAQAEANSQQNQSIALDAAEQASLRGVVAVRLNEIDALDQVRQAQEEYENTVIQGSRSMAEATGDWVASGLRDTRRFVDSVKDTFKRMFADLVAQAAQSGFMKLLGGIFGLGGSGAAFAGTGGSGITGLLGNLFGGGSGGGSLLGGLFGGGSGGIGSIGGGLLGAIGSLFGGGGTAAAIGAQSALAAGVGTLPGMAGAASLVPGIQAGATSGLLTGSGMSTAFAGVPIIGWIAAAMAANMSLFAQGWRPNGGSLTLPDGQRVTGGGSSGGRILDQLFNPGGLLGDRIGSLLSGSAVFTRLFGRKAPELTGQTTTMTLGAAGAGGSELYRILERGGVFRSDRRSTRTGALGDDATDAAQDLFDAVRQVMVDSARALEGDAPAMLDAALRTVVEYDKKGKIKSTKYFVDILGKTWEEATAEAATQRIAAEGMIATIDAILGTTVDAASAVVASAAGDVIGAAGDGAADAASRTAGVFDTLVKTAAAAQGEASAIAERWRGDAEMLADGAQMLLAAAVDIRAGNGLLGEGGTLTQIADLVEDLQAPGEALAATYARVATSAALLDQALGLSRVSLDGTREEIVRLAVEIVDAAGGLERAQGMWSRYFEIFYTETERLEFQIAQATERAVQMFDAAGLNLSDFTGDGGAAAFRARFESMLPTLSAAGVVQMLELADALGILIDLTGQAAGATTALTGTLAELMASVTEQLAEYAPAQTFAERMAAINIETDGLIARATALGATEAQLADIRELGAARLTEVLAAQAEAYGQYASIVRGVTDELADARGLSEFQREMREIDRALADTINSMNATARAAGMQGAAEADLAAAHELAAIRAAAAIARLEERGRSVVQELYGTPLERLNEQIAAIEAGIGSFAGGAAGGMEQVTQATDNAVQAQLGAQQRIRDWLDNLLLGDLGGLRPRDALAEAIALFERTIAAAPNDAEAMAALPGLADQVLRLGQRVYASGTPFFDLRNFVRDAMRGIAELQIEQSLPPPGGSGNTGGGGSIGGGAVGGDLTALYAEREALIARQAAEERRALATELAAVIRDLTASDPARSLDDIETTLGFSMRDLVTDLGVNLNELTVATASQLADIAQAMGVELTDLSGSVGLSLGSLADRQSLLNDALEAEIAGLPQGQRDLLEPLLRDVEEAAALGDTAGVESGIEAMEDAIGDLSPEIRDALAPFFAGIRPADPATELGHLSSMDTTLGSSLSELQAHTTDLAAIRAAVETFGGTAGIGAGTLSSPAGPITPPPSFAVGTNYVPQDGLAMIHRGEAVIPASVNRWLRTNGYMSAPRPAAFAIPAPGGSANNDTLVAELRELRRERREGDEYTRRLEQRVQQLEVATRESAQRQSAAVDRQTDAIRTGRR